MGAAMAWTPRLAQKASMVRRTLKTVQASQVQMDDEAVTDPAHERPQRDLRGDKREPAYRLSANVPYCDFAEHEYCSPTRIGMLTTWEPFSVDRLGESLKNPKRSLQCSSAGRRAVPGDRAIPAPRIAECA